MSNGLSWIIAGLMILTLMGCKKKDNKAIPAVTTGEVSQVAQTTALGSGLVGNDGGSAVTDRGLCWSLLPDPVLSGPHVSSGTGTGSFTGPLSGLMPDTTYFIRAYACNNQGTAYGNGITFRTLPEPSLPLVITAPITFVTSATAQGGGEVITDGGAPVTARGICWNTRHDPTTGDDKTSDGEGLGTFTSQLTGLNATVPYYVRAYATNSAGTAYGDTVSFVRILPDSIEYTLYDPPIGITSVRYMNPPTLQYDCYQPVPADSTASYYLDIDQDGTPEFRIFIRQWYEFHSASNPCYNFQYFSAIYSTRAGDSVAVINNNTEDCAIVLNEGAGISESLIYAERGVTVRRYWMAFPCNLGNSRAGGYYGFKILVDGKTMFGWLRLSYNGITHTITLHETAFNRTEGKPILAGQKE